MSLKPLLATLLLAVSAHAQFELQDSHSTASLRGIDTAGPGIAWASGSGGTVLRTVDGGSTWKPCAIPAGAEKLDFRGVQALDAQTAVILSSGKGDLSRIYKTTDGCLTWKLVFSNPDAEGFFDTLRRVGAHEFYILGDPVDNRFAIFTSANAGDTWSKADDRTLQSNPGDGAFAASNSSLTAQGKILYFGTGGTGLPHVYRSTPTCPTCVMRWVRFDVPLAAHAAASGVFSLGVRQGEEHGPVLVAVGGTYDKPTETAGTAAFSLDGGQTWKASATPPGGYRSSVVYDPLAMVWIAAGTTGADFSTDDGRTWATWPLLPPGAQSGWNAIALPYLVGSRGKIGKLTTYPSQR